MTTQESTEETPDTSHLPPIPSILAAVVSIFDPSYVKLYLKWMSLVNYAIVCGIGVFINQAVIHFVIRYTSLFIANSVAILVAFVWNWTFTVGPYGYLMGFKDQRSDIPGVQP